MDTHSTANGNTDSSKPAPSRETFALLESESELQRAFDHAADATFAIMKSGILHHNTAVGTPNTEDNGYHETLTRFWAGEIAAFIRSGHFTSRLEAARAAVAEFGGDRERFRLYYSFNVVRDRRAREWAK